jgi:hypothetical protein
VLIDFLQVKTADLSADAREGRKFPESGNAGLQALVRLQCNEDVFSFCCIGSGMKNSKANPRVEEAHTTRVVAIVRGSFLGPVRRTHIQLRGRTP